MSRLKLLVASLAACAVLASGPLQAQIYDWVYRVDERRPEVILQSGFHTAGQQTDLLYHALSDSCFGPPSQRSIWLSAYNSHELATAHILRRLREQAALPGQGLWVYSIHTDSNFLEVSDALHQVLQAAQQNEHGYGYEQVAQLRYILSRREISLRGEVVTQRRIYPRNIGRAQFFFLDPSSTPANPILREGSGFTNAHYREPATQMTNIRADLTTILPLTSIILYGEQLANVPDLCALCAGASNASSSRYLRSDILGHLNCPGLSRAQALIGSDE